LDPVENEFGSYPKFKDIINVISKNKKTHQNVTNLSLNISKPRTKFRMIFAQND